MSSGRGDRLTDLRRRRRQLFHRGDCGAARRGTMPVLQPAGATSSPSGTCSAPATKAGGATDLRRTIMAVNRLGSQGGDIFYAHAQAVAGPARHHRATPVVRGPTTAVDADHPTRDRRRAGRDRRRPRRSPSAEPHDGSVRRSGGSAGPALQLPQLGLGGATLGNIFDVIDDDAVRRDARSGVGRRRPFYDTAPWYGRGLERAPLRPCASSAARAGEVIALDQGRPRLFARRMTPPRFAASERSWPNGLHFEHRHDYTYAGIMRSYEDSLQRPAALNRGRRAGHPRSWPSSTAWAPRRASPAHLDHARRRSGIRALAGPEACGLIGRIGAGVNALGTIPPLPRPNRRSRLLPRRPALHPGRAARPRRGVPALRSSAASG